MNPYEQPALSGSVELIPQTDYWSRTEQLDLGIIRQTGQDVTLKLKNKIDLGEQMIDLGSVVTSQTESTSSERIRGRGDDTRTSKQL